MLNSNQSGLSIPKSLERSCLAFAVLENIYWPKGKMVFLLIGKVLLLKYLALIPLKYWGLVSGQFVARCTDRKTVRSWHPYRVTKSMSRVASKRSYTGSYPYFPGGCDKWPWAFKFRGQLNVYLAVLASDFRVSYCACSPAGWFVWPSC